MRTFATTLALAAVFAVAAAAQPQSGGNPPPMPTGDQSMPPPAMPPGAGQSGGTSPFRMVDAAIKALAEESGAQFWDCVKALDYLRGDLQATKRRVKAKGGGKVPSDQAGLIATKIKRVGRQQQACIDQTKQTNEHFTMAMRSLAGIEPNNSPGIPPRRAKIAAMRQKFNDGLKKLKADGVPLKTDEGEQGASDDSEQ